MNTKIMSGILALILCMAAMPLTALAAEPAQDGSIKLSDDGSCYTYTLPAAVPQHNYYSEAFSTSHEFRDIYITQFGSDKAIVYDMVAHVMIEAVHNDALDYAKPIHVYGFEKIADVKEMSSARLAVQKDMPFLQTFLSCQGGGSGYDYQFILHREVTNYFSNEAPNDNSSYIAVRNSVISELNAYRAAVAGIADDEEKLETVGQMFCAGAVYDKNAPYHAVGALLNKRGVCGSANWAFTMVGNAVGVPSYQLHVREANHAVTLVRPNGGELKVIDVTFGIRSPSVQSISSWKHSGKLTWDNDTVGFKNEYYFPDVDILSHLGGLS